MGVLWLLTGLVQLELKENIQELFHQPLTQEELHQVVGHFLSTLGRRGLINQHDQIRPVALESHKNTSLILTSHNMSF